MRALFDDFCDSSTLGMRLVQTKYTWINVVPSLLPPTISIFSPNILASQKVVRCLSFVNSETIALAVGPRATYSYHIIRPSLVLGSFVVRGPIASRGERGERCSNDDKTKLTDAN